MQAGIYLQQNPCDSRFNLQFLVQQYSMKTILRTHTTIGVAICAITFWLIANGCGLNAEPKVSIASPALEVTASPENEELIPAETQPTEIPVDKIADAATILKRPEVPVLCYHQIRDWKESDSKTARAYIVPVAAFKQQMKMLADSGYHAITPDQLYAYLATGAALPSKPVLITFDDTKLDQYTVALPEMNKYGFKGVFFVMTVSLDRPNYMSKQQVKALSDAGHTIGSHTWDHQNVKKYQDKDWITQVEKPSRQLESITGKPVKYFAYPFGLWNPEAIPHLKKYGMAAAFQLSAKRDPKDPLHSIRRIIVPGSWSPATLNTMMKKSF